MNPHRSPALPVRPWAVLRFAVALLTPWSVAAQIASDAPRLISPHGSSGLGVHWVRADGLPGADAAIVATWALPALPTGMRLRAGMGQGVATRNAFMAGIDLQTPLVRAGSGRAFDLDWQSGFGVSIGEYTLLTLPVGLTGGVSWTSGSVWLAPYVSAGVAADFALGGGAPATEFEARPTLELGLDVSLDQERRFVLRVATALVERRATSFGLAYGLGRLTR